MNTRLKKHKFDVLHNKKDKSALARHAVENGHAPDWDNATILDFNIDFRKRRFIESFFIQQEHKPMNDKKLDCFPEVYRFL